MQHPEIPTPFGSTNSHKYPILPECNPMWRTNWIVCHISAGKENEFNSSNCHERFLYRVNRCKNARRRKIWLIIRGRGGEGVELPCYHRNWSSEWMRWLYLKIVWTIFHGRGKIPSFVNCLKIYVMYIRFFWGVYAIIYSLNLGIFSFSAPELFNLHKTYQFEITRTCKQPTFFSKSGETVPDSHLSKPWFWGCFSF